MGYADLIADINETGTTLRANHLKPLAGGVILQSEACFLVNKSRFLQSAEHRETLRGVLEMIEAHRRAGGLLSVTANVVGASMEAVAALVLQRRDIAGVRGPTITPVFDPDQPGQVFAVTLVISARQLASAKEHLRQIGGGTITVMRPDYVFEERSQLYDQLVTRLGVGSEVLAEEALY